MRCGMDVTLAKTIIVCVTAVCIVIIFYKATGD